MSEVKRVLKLVCAGDRGHRLRHRHQRGQTELPFYSLLRAKQETRHRKGRQRQHWPGSQLQQRDLQTAGRRYETRGKP